MVALARAYERVEHGRVEHVAGYQGRPRLPEVTAATVEDHMATAHGYGIGWAQAAAAHPLIGGHKLTESQMLRAHHQAHQLAENHEHEPSVIMRKPTARDFQHEMNTVSPDFYRRIRAAAGRHAMADTLSLSDLTEEEVEESVVELSNMMGWDFADTWQEIRDRAGGERDHLSLAQAVASLYRDVAGEAPDVAASYNGDGYSDGRYLGLTDTYPAEPAADWTYDPAAERGTASTGEVLRLTAENPHLFRAEDVADAAFLSGYDPGDVATALELAAGGYDDPDSEIMRLSMMADDMNAKSAGRSPAALRKARLEHSNIHPVRRHGKGHHRGCSADCSTDHRQPRDGGSTHPEVDRYLRMAGKMMGNAESPHGNTHTYHPGRY
jgi:hypothetical protein